MAFWVRSVWSQLDCFDKIGVEGSIFTMNILALSFLVSVLIPYVAAQVTAMVFLTLTVNLFIVMLARFAQIYCPHELFGSFNGVLYLFLGIFQICATEICSSISSSIFSSNVWEYDIQFIFWGIMTLLTGILFFWWVIFKEPIPKPGESSLKNVHRLRSQMDGLFY